MYYLKYLWRQVNFYINLGGFYEKEIFISSRLFGVAMLTGCGANFQISASDLEKYSEDNSAVFSDVSNSYTETYNYLGKR